MNAKDNAGNINTRNYTFGIDVTAPTIEVEYDNNDAQNLDGISKRIVWQP